MLRALPKLKSFRPWVNSLVPHIIVGLENNSALFKPMKLPGIPMPTASAAAPTTIASTHSFVEDTQPLPIPVLRQRPDNATESKWTCGEYLKGDPQRLEVLVPEEVDKHRMRIMEELSIYKNRKLGNTHILILAGASAQPGCRFQQRSEFLYVCDCLFPGAVLLMVRNRRLELHTMLFLPQTDAESTQLACRLFNVDEVLPISRIRQTLLIKLQCASVRLWYSQEKGPLGKLIRELADHYKLPIECPFQTMQYVRSVKSELEMDGIRRASSIAAMSLQELMTDNIPQQYERQLSILFAQKCQQRHAHQPLPYEPKVAAGFGGMWLMDASCQYAGYCSSLARCWPIADRFTPPQKVVYSILLELQSKLCKLICRCDTVARTPRELQSAYFTLLYESLRGLRVLPSNLKDPKDIYKAASRFSCFSTLIKHVGLDLMESSEELFNCPLMPGNVISMQMSICIPPDCQQAYPEFRGVLCIIADTFLINENYELEFLTDDCLFQGHAKA